MSDQLNKLIADKAEPHEVFAQLGADLVDLRAELSSAIYDKNLPATQPVADKFAMLIDALTPLAVAPEPAPKAKAKSKAQVAPDPTPDPTPEPMPDPAI